MDHGFGVKSKNSLPIPKPWIFSPTWRWEFQLSRKPPLIPLWLGRVDPTAPQVACTDTGWGDGLITARQCWKPWLSTLPGSGGGLLTAGGGWKPRLPTWLPSTPRNLGGSEFSSPSLGYRKQNQKTQETHHCALLWVPRSITSLSSFYFSESLMCVLHTMSSVFSWTQKNREKYISSIFPEAKMLLTFVHFVCWNFLLTQSFSKLSFTF